MTFIFSDRVVNCHNILLSSSLCKTSSEPHLFDNDREISAIHSKTFKVDYNSSGKNVHIQCHACPINVKGKCISCIGTCHFHIGRVYNGKSEKKNLSREKQQDVNIKCVSEKPKRTIMQAIVHEIRHYYNGSRLLAINTKISWKLARKLLKGQTLTRRENNLVSKYKVH